MFIWLYKQLVVLGMGFADGFADGFEARFESSGLCLLKFLGR